MGMRPGTTQVIARAPSVDAMRGHLADLRHQIAATEERIDREQQRRRFGKRRHPGLFAWTTLAVEALGGAVEWKAARTMYEAYSVYGFARQSRPTGETVMTIRRRTALAHRSMLRQPGDHLYHLASLHKIARDWCSGSSEWIEQTITVAINEHINAFVTARQFAHFLDPSVPAALTRLRYDLRMRARDRLYNRVIGRAHRYARLARTRRWAALAAEREREDRCYDYDPEDEDMGEP